MTRNNPKVIREGITRRLVIAALKNKTWKCYLLNNWRLDLMEGK